MQEQTGLRNFNFLVMGKYGGVPESVCTASIIPTAESIKAGEQVCIRVQRLTAGRISPSAQPIHSSSQSIYHAGSHSGALSIQLE